MYVAPAVRSRKSIVIALVVAAQLAASCTPADPEAERVVSDNSEQFSAEERRIAAALSVGSSAILDDGSTPLQRAVDCAAALEFFVDRLDGSGILTEEQGRVANDILAYYRAEANRLVGTGKRSDGGEQTPQGNTTPMSNSQKAQTGLACLRQGAELYQEG